MWLLLAVFVVGAAIGGFVGFVLGVLGMASEYDRRMEAAIKLALQQEENEELELMARQAAECAGRSLLN